MKIYYEKCPLTEARRRVQESDSFETTRAYFSDATEPVLVLQHLNYPTNDDVKIKVGDRIDLSGVKSRKIVLIETVTDLKNFAEDINLERRCQLWEYKTVKDNEQFKTVLEVCRPAFGCGALSYDEANQIIYAQGPNSYASKITGGNNTVRFDMVTNFKLGDGYVPLIGGFQGMPVVKLINDSSMAEFVNAINRVFPS